jgi:hypothetical protein
LSSTSRLRREARRARPTSRTSRGLLTELRWRSFVRSSSRFIPPVVYVANVDGGNLRRLGEGEEPAWGLDGRLFGPSRRLSRVAARPHEHRVGTSGAYLCAYLTDKNNLFAGLSEPRMRLFRLPAAKRRGYSRRPNGNVTRTCPVGQRLEVERPRARGVYGLRRDHRTTKPPGRVVAASAPALGLQHHHTYRRVSLDAATAQVE